MMEKTTWEKNVDRKIKEFNIKEIAEKFSKVDDLEDMNLALRAVFDEVVITPQQRVDVLRKYVHSWYNKPECKELLNLPVGTVGRTVGRLNLEGISLRSTNLEGLISDGLTFEDNNLTGVDFEKASLKKADMTGADLLWANFKSANLEDVSFEEARLIGANLMGANLKDAEFENADLKNAIIIGVKDLDITDEQRASAISTPEQLNNALEEILKLDGDKITEKHSRRLPNLYRACLDLAKDGNMELKATGQKVKNKFKDLKELSVIKMDGIVREHIPKNTITFSSNEEKNQQQKQGTILDFESAQQHHFQQKSNKR